MGSPSIKSIEMLDQIWRGTVEVEKDPQDANVLIYGTGKWDTSVHKSE